MPATPSLPVYLLAPGALGAPLRAAFADADAMDSAEELRPLSARQPGLVVLEQDALPAGEALSLASEAHLEEPGWVVALARPEGSGGIEVRTLSLGAPARAADVARWAAGDGTKPGFLESRRVLTHLARARHDINNPLTAGLGETQLLLLDAPPGGEVREGLETIEAQLRRIRDLVSALGDLRSWNGGT